MLSMYLLLYAAYKGETACLQEKYADVGIGCEVPIVSS